MKCNSCNNICSDSAKFCPKCGNKLEQIPICKECGRVLENSVKFCPNCGTPNSLAIQTPNNEDASSPSNILYRFPQNTNLSELEEAVKNYNMKATEYGGYTLFELNHEKKYLAGEYHDKTTVGLGWGKTMKVSFQNGLMEADYEEVCKIASKLSK